MMQQDSDAPVRRAVGLMSGTSLDGIDVALLETDGRGIVRPGPSASFPYAPEDREILRRALAEAPALLDRTARPGALAEAECVITRRHAQAVSAFLAAEGIDRASIDVIGFHGQTVLHRPEIGLTIQVGNGQALADSLGIPVVHDFRARDMAEGGEGAPLVPVFHRALAAAAGLPRPLGVLNLGGVGNATWIGREEKALIAFDTGPGNALLDDFIRARTGLPMDADGRFSAAGHIDIPALQTLLEHEFFDRPPPKSLDRNTFSRTPVDRLTTSDGAATLAAFTVGAVALGARFLPEPPGLWIVAGGGARNPTLMRLLARRLKAEVKTADEIGWSAEALEAQAFAYLAVRALDGLPLTFPGTTGVDKPVTGGVLARPSNAMAGGEE